MEWKWNCLWQYGCNIWEFVVHFPNTKSGWSSENLNLRLQPDWYLVSSPLSSLLLLSPAFAASSIGGLASWTHDHGGGGEDEGVVDDDHVVVVMKVLWMMTMLQGLDIITVSQPCSVSQEWHGVTGYFCLQPSLSSTWSLFLSSSSSLSSSLTLKSLSSYSSPGRRSGHCGRLKMSISISVDSNFEEIFGSLFEADNCVTYLVCILCQIYATYLII